MEVEWRGFTGQCKFNLQLGEFAGSYSSPSLQVTEQNQLLRVKDFQGDFNSHPGIKGISVGFGRPFYRQYRGYGQREYPFQSGVFWDFKAESGVSGETVNVALLLSFEKLSAGGLGLGPFALEFEARKLDADVLSRLEKFCPGIAKKSCRAGTENAKGEIKKLFTPIMLELFGKFPGVRK